MYKVLWFDDEHSRLETIKEDAHEFELELIGFSTAKEGINELKKNFNQYIAVIVDGLFFNSSQEDGIAVDGNAFGEVAKFLNAQKETGRIIPWFIYSGQPSFIKQKNIIIDILADTEFNCGKVYDKNNDDDFKKLCTDIIKYAQKIENIKIRFEYSEPFNCFGNKYLDPKYENLLYNVIIILNNKTLSDPETLLFTPCRLLLEAIFKIITDVDNKVLPYALVKFDKQRAALTNCAKFLNGEMVYINNVKTFPANYFKDSGCEHIGKQVQTIIRICHPASHDIQNYSPYTFKSVLWALFDILIWLKKFIDERK